tara:strand:+ start:1143 stop:1412 length:270 start_codon:yes stop_codon:yes gene_type:complete
MRHIIKLFSGLIFVSVFVLGFYAYFIRSTDGGIIYDGLGRQLHIVPLFARLFVPDSLWAGFYWYVIDFVVFFGGIAFAAFLMHLIDDSK